MMYKKSVAVFVTLIFAALSIITAGADDTEPFELIDAENGKAFSVHLDEDFVQIFADGKSYPKFNIKNILTCSVADGIFSFYNVDSLNKQLCVYRIDPEKDTSCSFAINCTPLYDKNCFTSDTEGNVYFVNKYSTCSLCIYSNETTLSINANSQIRQLLYLVGGNVAVITDNSTLIYSNQKLSEGFSLPLATPVAYTSDGFFTDAVGNKYSFTQGAFKAHDSLTESTAGEPAEASAENSSVKAAFSDVAEDTLAAEDLGIYPVTAHIYSAPAGTTVSNIKKAFATSGNLTITKANGKIIESGKIGTACIVQGENDFSITLIIYGELTGEGNINSRDIKAILDHLSGKELLAEPFRTAADVDSDNIISAQDALIIAKMY